MIKTLINALKVKEIRNRILFTLLILAFYRFGSQITVPGIDPKALSNIGATGIISLLDTVSGGGLGNYSLFSMGVSPFITAQIVVQLLQMEIIPKFTEWSKQGEVGRRHLNQATRYLTIILAFVQSIGITAGFNAISDNSLVTGNSSVSRFIVIGLILTAGTMLLTWMGEQITNKGIGNGISMIIFAGIISRLPSGITQVVLDQFNKATPLWKSIMVVSIIAIAIVAIITFVTFVQQAMRKIPIQYTRREAGSGESSYLPLKVNVAGVIPVIFASSFIVTPATILVAFAGSHGSDGWYQVMSKVFNMQTPEGMVLYGVLIILFTYFYAFVQVNPEKLAENLVKQGSYIPGVRPGNETEKYISAILYRLSTIGSLFLAVVALLPQVAASIWGLPQSIGLGGTSLLIVVGVALESARQLDGLLMKRKYHGFIEA